MRDGPRPTTKYTDDNFLLFLWLLRGSVVWLISGNKMECKLVTIEELQLAYIIDDVHRASSNFMISSILMGQWPLLIVCTRIAEDSKLGKQIFSLENRKRITCADALFSWAAER